MSSFSEPDRPVGGAAKPELRTHLVVLGLAAAAVAVSACTIAVALERDRLIEAQLRALEVEAGRAADTTDRWFHERIGDAEVLAHDAATRRAVSGGEVSDRAELTRKLEQLREAYGYVEAFVLSADAEPVATAPPMTLPADVRALAEAAMRAGGNRQQLFDRGAHVAFASPIPPPAGGAAVLEMDVSTTLAPSLKGMLATRTGETLLVHRRGVELVFVSPRRAQPGAQGPLVLHANDASELAATAAVSRPAGSGEFLDYRGRSVIAATRPLAQSGWGLVVKIDRDEALEPLAAYTRTAIGLAVLAVLATISIGAVLRLRARTRQLNEELARERAALALQRAEERSAAERRALKEQLLQAQKMEAVGRLAGGVAHDFNNLLTLMLVAVDGLCEGLGPGSPLFQDAHDVRRTAERAAELTKQLLAFSRTNIQRLEPVNVNQTVRDVVGLLRRAIPEDVVFKLDLCEGDAWCETDRPQLEQALLNLVINARDAMPRGGRLTISSAVEPIAVARAASDQGSGRSVALRVVDTGEGIPADALAKVFEPFFTTKPDGKGTGLGLAMVHSFISQCGGSIEVRSEPGKGTAFELRFAEASAPAHQGTAEPAKALPSRDGITVLVVDDSPQVREAAVRVLRGAGFTVHEASTGREALAVFERNADRVEIVLTDVVMPEMGGRELAAALRAQRPALPILFMSGYADDAALRDEIRTTRERFVAKPFSSKGLTDAVRAALNPAEPAAGP